MKRAALYLRVSTLDQHPESQLYDLRGLAAQRGFQIIQEYTDKISGSKAKRPGLDRLMSDARRGRFDVVVVRAFDRMARTGVHARKGPPTATRGIPRSTSCPTLLFFEAGRAQDYRNRSCTVGGDVQIAAMAFGVTGFDPKLLSIQGLTKEGDYSCDVTFLPYFCW